MTDRKAAPIEEPDAMSGESPGPVSSPEARVPATGPRQEEMPFAVVGGAPVTELPHDLYIPPDALEVFLEAFEGPLDLLLYLIKRQNLDILNIPVAEITRQYLHYIGLMKDLRLELAAEYLLMAAMLAEIKSRMLLPRPESETEEDDPRAELVRRLQEYERYKQAAEALDGLPRIGRDLFPVRVDAPFATVPRVFPKVHLRELLAALTDVMARAEMYSRHHVSLDPLSVRERMSLVLEHCTAGRAVEFSTLFTPEEGRAGVVVTLLAVLELVKDRVIELTQARPFGPIHLQAPAA